MTLLKPADAQSLRDAVAWAAEASQPIELLALVFEGQRATSTSEATRRALALAINRPAICAVLLQRQGEPASALLPHWLSGYGSLFATSYSGASARALGTSLPADQRTLALRVEPTDPVSQSVAERIAVDGREAGITIKVEPAGTLAPRPDVRLIRVMLSPTSPERALARLLADLGPRITALLTPDPPPGPGAALEAVYQFERALVEHHIIVPIVHIPELYGIGAQVESWNGPIVLPSGAWDLASVWIRADKP